MCGSASFDFPVVLFSDPADAGPAIFFHRHKVFEAFQVHGHIGSFLSGGFFADGFGFVDVVDASDLEVVGAVVGNGQG